MPKSLVAQEKKGHALRASLGMLKSTKFYTVKLSAKMYYEIFLQFCNPETVKLNHLSAFFL